MKKKIFLADLTHTKRGIHAPNFPLGTAFVCSYAKKVLGNDFDIKLFKFPDQFNDAINNEHPALIGLSNYCWNLELGYALSSWAKKQYPNLIVVFGGPNFPLLASEKTRFLSQRPAIDFYIQNEGEAGFVELVKVLKRYEFDVAKLKNCRELIVNCNYLTGSELVEGPIERIKDLNVIPSPYLEGILDEFFELSLVPMIETTRGCPFSCTYCSDGIAIKDKVTRFDMEKKRDELNYIRERVRNVDEIIITDLDFGMYKEDVITAQYIAEIQKEYGWPILVKGSSGKNNPERIMEVASILDGSWMIGYAIQHSDMVVLENIKRINISLKSFDKFIKFCQKLNKDAMTYSEIILALPGDTKEKHFKALQYCIEKGVNNLRMYQAMLLEGTEMASQDTREKFNLMTKFRIIPGGLGNYQFGSKEYSIVEIEEIIVGGRDMTFDDYVSCRVMNLIIEIYVNDAFFEEVFSCLKVMNIPIFDCLVYLHKHTELYTPKMKEIFESYIDATKNDLYTSREEAEQYIRRPEIINKYISGELGINELLVHKALLYLELEDVSNLLFKVLKNYLKENNVLNPNAEMYFDQLQKFILCRKKLFHEYDQVHEQLFNFDFTDIAELNFEIDPRNIKQSDHQVCFKFFHNQTQKEHIRNSLDLYANTHSGIGRLIQRSNLKKMYRCFEKF